jgi:predicted ATPase/DNA-binding SARP family transcriptional activator/Tfp pilus assembly protein PilF
MDAPYARLYLLGPFGIALAQTEAQIGVIPDNPARPRLRRKSRALVAYLAVAAQPMRRETLAALFFPQSDDPLGALRWHLSEIRRQVGAVMVAAQQNAIHFDHRRCWVDAYEFDQILSPDALPSVEQLAEALKLYRGDYLADISLPDAPEFDMWLLGQRAHYRQRYELALTRLVERLTQHEQYAQALPWAQRLVQSDALAEPANLHLIRLYALNGQRAAALAHYEQYRRLLHAEIQAAPGPHATALHAEIAAGRMTARSEPSSQPQLLPPRRHNLPAPTTPFLGRNAELAHLRAMLADPSYRLVTLVGPGGVGKTRLALQIAADLGLDDHFADGVYLATLAAIPSGAALIPAIADAVGLAFSGAEDPRRQLLAYLRGQSLLLVLDNFEHLVDAAELLTEILSAAPGVTILATSRVRLHLYEEWCFELQGLPLPDDSTPDSIETSSAVQLFVQRARHSQRSFVLETEQPAVLRICRLLDGIPLAIELAAGRVRSHTCGEIADEIQHSLDFLATDLRNIPERHRSMRVAFEHSWRLMSETERMAFARLSVFHGGFDRRAAEDVAGVTRNILSALIDASMLQGASDGRYQLHELLRQFGAAKLTTDGADDIRQKHSHFYAAYVEQQGQHKLTAQEPAALQALGIELENMRASWRWAVTSLADPVRAGAAAAIVAKSAPILGHFFAKRSRFQEGVEFFQQAAHAMDAAGWYGDDPAQPLTGDMRLAYTRVRLSEALLCYMSSQFVEVERIVTHVLPLLRASNHAREAAEALVTLGRAYFRMGRYDDATHELHESLRLCEQIGDRIGSAEALNILANIAVNQDRPDDAHMLFQECLSIYEASGYQRGVAQILSNLGTSHGRRGDYIQAKRYYEQAFCIISQLGEIELSGIMLSNRGSASRELGEYSQAISYYEESLKIFRKIGQQRWIGASLNGLGETFLDMGDPAAARPRVREALDIGLAIRSLPDTLESIAGLGEILAKTDATREIGLSTASFVASQPVTPATPKRRSKQIMEQLKAQLPESIWQATVAHGADQALDNVVSALMRLFPANSD